MHSRTPYNINKVLLRTHNLLKASIIFTLSKWAHPLISCCRNVVENLNLGAKISKLKLKIEYEFLKRASNIRISGEICVLIGSSLCRLLKTSKPALFCYLLVILC